MTAKRWAGKTGGRSSTTGGERRAPRVLVAEDSTVVRERLVWALKEAGVARVDEAATVDETVALARERGPDVVLLDLELRDGSGLAAVPAILAANPRALVVVLTNHAAPEYRRRAQAAGAHLFFDKSVAFERAVEAVRAQVNKHRQRR